MGKKREKRTTADAGEDAERVGQSRVAGGGSGERPGRSGKQAGNFFSTKHAISVHTTQHCAPGNAPQKSHVRQKPVRGCSQQLVRHPSPPPLGMGTRAVEYAAVNRPGPHRRCPHREGAEGNDGEERARLEGGRVSHPLPHSSQRWGVRRAGQGCDGNRTQRDHRAPAAATCEGTAAMRDRRADSTLRPRPSRPQGIGSRTHRRSSRSDKQPGLCLRTPPCTLRLHVTYSPGYSVTAAQAGAISC